MTQKLNEVAFGYSLAIISAAWMLALGILGRLGIYVNGVEAMQNWHLFFSLSFFGIIAGIIEAAIFSFIFAWLFARIYNKFT